MPAGQRPLWKQGRGPGARSGVRILVYRYVDTSRSRIEDEFQGLGALAPVRLPDNLVMRYLCRQTTILTYAYGLGNTVDHGCRLVAHVRDVHSAETPATFANSTTSSV